MAAPFEAFICECSRESYSLNDAIEDGNEVALNTTNIGESELTESALDVDSRLEISCMCASFTNYQQSAPRKSHLPHSRQEGLRLQ